MPVYFVLLCNCSVLSVKKNYKKKGGTFQLYHDKKKLHINEMMIMLVLYNTNHTELELYSATSLKKHSADRYVSINITQCSHAYIPYKHNTVV